MQKRGIFNFCTYSYGQPCKCMYLFDNIDYRQITSLFIESFQKKIFQCLKELYYIKTECLIILFVKVDAVKSCTECTACVPNNQSVYQKRCINMQ